MVTLSTVNRNYQFQSLILAELYGVEHIKENCCIRSELGNVLAFKRKSQDKFTRTTKQADTCEPMVEKNGFGYLKYGSVFLVLLAAGQY
jgi:hypothetical protein